MMPKGINHSPNPPTILILYSPNHLRTGLHRLRKHCIGIVHDQHHANRPAIQRLWTEILMLRGLIGHPEIGVVHSELGNYVTAVGSVHAI